jgi:hypothetical protein
MLRVHMLREEVAKTGPGLDWISPDRRRRVDIKMFVVCLKGTGGRDIKKDSGKVLSDSN